MLTRFERIWVPMGLAFGTCGLVIGALTVTRLMLQRDELFEPDLALERCAWVLGIIACCSCLACHFVEPGSPQPDPNDPPPEDEQDDAQRIRQRVLPDGRPWQQKWCKECHVWRPHRCGHCSICGRCILRLDHHCGFMGTCVGERNSRFFAAFLLSAGLGLVCLTILAVRYLTFIGCWRDFTVWFHMWQPLAILIFFCCCPFPLMSPLIAAPSLTGAGLSYTAMMVADTEIVGETSVLRGGLTWDTAMKELRGLVTCRGARTYYCGPLVLQGPCCPRRSPEAPLPVAQRTAGLRQAQVSRASRAKWRNCSSAAASAPRLAEAKALPSRSGPGRGPPNSPLHSA